MKNFSIILICFYVFCLAVVFSTDSFAVSSAKTGFEPCSVSKDFLRPDTDLLFKTIHSGRSLMSEQSRHRVADLIKEMDEAHMRFLRIDQSNICGVDNFKSYLKTRSVACHKFTPIAERTLIAALSLQIQILDIFLNAQNPMLSEKLKKERSMVRIKKKTESCFGDKRDIFVNIVLQHYSQIGSLQKALGASGEIHLPFPKEARSFADVEAYLVDKLILIRNRATAINN